MAITCTPTELAQLAEKYVDMEWSVRQAIRILNWCAFLNGTPMVCDPKLLINEARNFYTCLNAAQLDAIETYLSCRIANAGGGGAVQVFNGNYGGGPPTQTPSSSAAIAYDLDSPFTQFTWSGTSWV